MSAPTVERSIAPQRPVAAPTVAATPRTPAAARAYARRVERRARILPAEDPAVAVARTPFVLLIMVLLGAGLVTSLWLSTAAAADSYRLDAAGQQARDLSEQSDRLRREVAVMQSAPALAEAAGRLGMVPAGDPARLVVRSDGSVQVLGSPTPVRVPAPPAPPTPPAPSIGVPAGGEAVPGLAAPGHGPAGTG